VFTARYGLDLKGECIVALKFKRMNGLLVLKQFNFRSVVGSQLHQLSETVRTQPTGTFLNTSHRASRVRIPTGAEELSLEVHRAFCPVGAGGKVTEA
jgi:hypothetical protein